MGCDGGTIPTRDELVRTKKKPEQKDKKSELAFRWRHCALSQEPLRKPVIACELGRLYNKESILELLLDRSKFEGDFGHIKGLRNIKELQLTENPAFKALAAKGDALTETSTAEYICPVSGLEMNGVFKFAYLHTCGCVFSERALTEIKSTTCNKCGKEYTKEDIIILNGSEEEVDALYTRMEARRLQAKQQKKKKKTAESLGTSKESEEPSEKKRHLEPSEPTAGHSNDTEKTHSVKSKLATVGSGAKSAAAASGRTLNGKQSDKKPVPIQKDKTTSAAYKALFTTSEKCKNQAKGHWVTYNPQYN